MCRRPVPLATILGVVCALPILWSSHDWSRCDSIALRKLSVNGVRVSVIQVDLNDPAVSIEVGLPAKGISHSESFESMVSRSSPAAAVTGTYFCTRSLLPVGTIVTEGRTVHQGSIGSTICFTESNQVSFLDTARGQSADLSGMRCALRAGPRLLNRGHYALNPRREGFGDPGLFGRRVRMAIGVTQCNKLLLVAVSTPVTFAETARTMRSLGAVDAMCLDGGTSSAMYYRGKLIRAPGRALTNVIEIHRRSGTRAIEPGAAAQLKRAATVESGSFRMGWIAAEPAAVRISRSSLEHGRGEPWITQEQPGLPTPQGLCRAEGRGALLPVYRAKLSGLKRAQHPKGFVHATSHA